jgi:hypothetical protein
MQGLLMSMPKKLNLKLALGEPVVPISNNLILIVDQKLGGRVLDVCAGAFGGLADTLVEQFPNEEEREEFKYAMVGDLSNPEFRLFIWV